jgi:HEXXH motif-containing protein
VEVRGLFDGRLSVKVAGEDREVPLSSAGRSAHGGFLRECPQVTHDGWTLALQPHAFNVPGSPIAEPALRAGLDYDEWHAPLVRQALEHMQRYLPETFDDFRRAIHVAALKPRHWSFYDDYSDPDMPGAFIASAVPNGLEMADHFVHQFQHIRLSCIEEYGPLFDGTRGDAYGDASYYSPWRDKLRAIYGIYHGVYVVIALTRYWLNVYEANAVGAQDRAYAVDCLLRLPRQLALALGVLRKYAVLTPLGQAIFEEYVRDVDALRARLGRIGLPADARALKVAEDGGYVPELSRADGRPLTVMGALREHLRTNDTANQCAGLVEELS